MPWRVGVGGGMVGVVSVVFWSGDGVGSLVFSDGLSCVMLRQRMLMMLGFRGEAGK